MILTDMTDEVWARRGHRLAVTDQCVELSYLDLLQASGRISRSLQRVVQAPGQFVALLVPNSAPYVGSFFAIARVGGVIAPLDPRSPTPELRRYIADLNPAALITEEQRLPRVMEAVKDLESSPAVLTVSRDLTPWLVAPGHGPAPALAGSASPPLLQQYTSGSTGTPKRVVRTHAAVVQEIAALRQTLGVGEDDRFIGVAPFSHVNGLVRTMAQAMVVGARLYPIEEFNRRRVLAVLARQRITVFGAVPQVFVLLTQATDDSTAFASVRLLFSSSAPLLVADNQRFRERWGKFISQLYGSTETGTISVSPGQDVDRHLGSVGYPLHGVRLEIRSAEGRPLQAGEEGEIAIASPFAATEYLDNPQATAASFRDEWYLSGDLGCLDSGGRLTITGRTKLLINRGGFKVNPYEVEEAILSHPKVQEVAVFGALGPHADEEVCCVIVPREECTADEIIAHCRDRLANYKVPQYVEFREAIPKASTGKILRSALERRHQGGSPRGI